MGPRCGPGSAASPLYGRTICRPFAIHLPPACRTCLRLEQRFSCHCHHPLLPICHPLAIHLPPICFEVLKPFDRYVFWRPRTRPVPPLLVAGGAHGRAEAHREGLSGGPRGGHRGVAPPGGWPYDVGDLVVRSLPPGLLSTRSNGSVTADRSALFPGSRMKRPRHPSARYAAACVLNSAA